MATMSAATICFLVMTAAIVGGKPQYGGGPPSGAQFPPMPPELERLLPADIVAQLRAIHSDPSSGFLEKQEKIDKVMTSVPHEILDKIPKPPGFEKLPENVRADVKRLIRDPNLSFQQKQDEIRKLAQSLPSHLRMLLAGPMSG